ncbi:HAD family hydrolase [Saccharopolyspora sp. MS10]|uniref:HAD family hydrolase n=1 Tax=Saccharopolyspora sp. MS10 TaxID=3385973 RepID=UPI0039A3830E
MTSAPHLPAPEPGRIKAVCLDIDDTLLDNAASSRLGLRALIGNDAAWPVWRHTTEEHYARYVAGELDFERMCRERTRAFFAAFGERLTEEEAAAREDYRMTAMQAAWRLFDDALPCLEWMRASGLQLAVITNAPGAYQRLKISRTGLAGSFDSMLISGELGVAKPDPRIFHAACAALDAAPHEVVHVGDRLDTDALGATDAGLHGVWLNRNGTEHAPPPGVSMITSLAELPELLVCELPFAPIPVRGGGTGSAVPGPREADGLGALAH